MKKVEEIFKGPALSNMIATSHRWLGQVEVCFSCKIHARFQRVSVGGNYKLSF